MIQAIVQDGLRVVVVHTVAAALVTVDAVNHQAPHVQHQVVVVHRQAPTQLPELLPQDQTAPRRLVHRHGQAQTTTKRMNSTQAGMGHTNVAAMSTADRRTRTLPIVVMITWPAVRPVTVPTSSRRTADHIQSRTDGAGDR